MILVNRLNHFPAQLSGGEQQRVAIARAVAKRPELLLCDEPTGALDFQTGKLVLDVIEKVNRELGTTTLVITHNASIAGMADRVVRLRSGELSEDRRILPGCRRRNWSGKESDEATSEKAAARTDAPQRPDACRCCCCSLRNFGICLHEQREIFP